MQVPVVRIYNYLDQAYEVFRLQGERIKVGDSQHLLWRKSRG